MNPARRPTYAVTPETVALFNALTKADLFDVAMSFSGQVSESIDDPASPASVERLVEEVSCLAANGLIPEASHESVQRGRTRVARQSASIHDGSHAADCATCMAVRARNRAATPGLGWGQDRLVRA